jgi:hypothetical protein
MHTISIPYGSPPLPRGGKQAAWGIHAVLSVKVSPKGGAGSSAARPIQGAEGYGKTLQMQLAIQVDGSQLNWFTPPLSLQITFSQRFSRASQQPLAATGADESARLPRVRDRINPSALAILDIVPPCKKERTGRSSPSRSAKVRRYRDRIYF